MDKNATQSPFYFILFHSFIEIGQLRVGAKMITYSGSLLLS